MTKIAILTFHQSSNYGAVLQAYALQSAFNSVENVSTYILDYNSREVYSHSHLSGFLRDSGGVVKNVIRMVLMGVPITIRNHYFALFRKHNLHILQTNIKKEDLSVIAAEYDAVVVGSDQVWNSEITENDSSYLLDFVPKGVKKFSYAASIGRDHLSDTEFQNLILRLQDFEVVSVRESYWESRIQKVIYGKTVRCDIDPVFLLNAKQWSGLVEKSSIDNYVLYFTLDSGKLGVSVANFAKRLADSKGLIAVYLSSDDRWFRFLQMKHFGIVGPGQFLGAIDGAKYVVTNSFHGTAFSIIFHKPFFVEIKNTIRNGRILHLLELTGLTDHILENGVLRQKPAPIDWEQVDARIANAVQSSKDYIQGIMSSLK